ncbi:MAG: ESX-1 secretion-associated protein [Mycobacteriaceae bacterium]|nr:ESX-1 secretion-associated protein [Mycobacteriaceae bacterium]
MAEFSVVPAHLETLAVKQDQAAANTALAAAATTHLKRDTELTWGPFWQMVNDAFAQTERKRNAAIKRLEKSCTDHAEKLRAATQIYTSSDDQLAEHLTNQIPDRQASAPR